MKILYENKYSFSIKPLSQLRCGHFPTACDRDRKRSHDRSQGIVRRSHGACDRLRSISSFEHVQKTATTACDRLRSILIAVGSYDHCTTGRAISKAIVRSLGGRATLARLLHDRLKVVQRSYDCCTIARRSHYWRTTGARPLHDRCTTMRLLCDVVKEKSVISKFDLRKKDGSFCRTTTVLIMKATAIHIFLNRSHDLSIVRSVFQL